MDRTFSIRAVGPAQRDLLSGMYDRFDPLGGALGLPPHTGEARRAWIAAALGNHVNIAAFSPAGEVVGHCFLAADKPDSAEVAIFVHQEFRRRGLGAALMKAALELGAAAGLRRVWSMTSSDNRAALRLQMSCGFRLVNSVSHEVELEIDLPVAESTFPTRLASPDQPGPMSHARRACLHRLNTATGSPPCTAGCA
jgi:GNAT superfamily N-acetyltransferase